MDCFVTKPYSSKHVLSGTEDADYHIHWTRLASAIQRCGIKELKRPGESSSLIREEAETVKSRIEREAMEGALRIAALAGVLTQNSYLRLDPSVIGHTPSHGGPADKLKFLAATSSSLRSTEVELTSPKRAE